MKNKLLGLNEVLSLSEGAEVWVENEEPDWDGIYRAEYKDGEFNLLRPKNPDWGVWIANTCKKHYREWMRCWVKKPTDSERKRYKWKE